MNDKKTVFEEVADGQDILRIGNYEFPSRAYIGHVPVARVDGLGQGPRLQKQFARRVEHEDIGGPVDEPLLAHEPPGERADGPVVPVDDLHQLLGRVQGHGCTSGWRNSQAR